MRSAHRAEIRNSEEAMKRRRVVVPGVSEPDEGLSSNCFVVGNFVVISGLTARDADGKPTALGDPYQQATTIFERIKAFMSAAGGTMSDIIKLNCYLTDIRHRDDFVRARRHFFVNDFPPCVVIGGVVFTSPELLMEIDAWAILDSEPNNPAE
jgi:2-iminobutanoate/2-iminopropanoate deaminase